MSEENGRCWKDGGCSPRAGAPVYSLREKVRLVRLLTVLNAAVTATINCHVGSQPGPGGRTKTRENLSAPSLRRNAIRTAGEILRDDHGRRMWLRIRSACGKLHERGGERRVSSACTTSAWHWMTGGKAADPWDHRAL